ncbi:hypothetical protein AB6A40_011287 [Gnathostoma spinigerum]|uniref:Uncharacterized protein n=1 Tax=Gnathostoma spinigerum TaxID=75299 RepID=A0ABD6EX85_9BILA
MYMSFSILIINYSEADQKRNPSAVVNVLNFYAKNVMVPEANKQKFIMTKSHIPSDEDIDEYGLSGSNDSIHHSISKDDAGISASSTVESITSVSQLSDTRSSSPPPPAPNNTPLSDTNLSTPPSLPPRQSKAPPGPPLPPSRSRTAGNVAGEGFSQSISVLSPANDGLCTSNKRIPPPLPPKPTDLECFHDVSSGVQLSELLLSVQSLPISRFILPPSPMIRIQSPVHRECHLITYSGCITASFLFAHFSRLFRTFRSCVLGRLL